MAFDSYIRHCDVAISLIRHSDMSLSDSDIEINNITIYETWQFLKIYMKHGNSLNSTGDMGDITRHVETCDIDIKFSLNRYFLN